MPSCMPEVVAQSASETASSGGALAAAQHAGKNAALFTYSWWPPFAAGLGSGYACHRQLQGW